MPKAKELPENTLPAGKYYIGDPCYTLQTKNHNDWLQILHDCDFFNKPYVKGRLKAIGLSTAYGDGEFEDQFGRRYPVDAGMIGAVPEKMGTPHFPDGVHLVEFKEPFVVKSEGDVLYFGDIRINTGWDEGEEEFDIGWDEFNDELNDDEDEEL